LFLKEKEYSRSTSRTSVFPDIAVSWMLGTLMKVEFTLGCGGPEVE
jgi:hypothetical protein